MKNANLLTLLEAAAFLEKRDEQINENNRSEVVEWTHPDNHSSPQINCTLNKNKSSNNSVKRMHHNELERLRRKELRSRVENLRKLVPGMKRSSTQQLLANTIKYIKLLTIEDDKLKLEEQFAEKKHFALKKKFQKLKNSFHNDDVAVFTTPNNSNSNFVPNDDVNNDRPNNDNSVLCKNNDDVVTPSAEHRSSTSSSGFSDSGSYSSDMSDSSVNDRDCWNIERRKLHSTCSNSSFSSSTSITEDSGFFADKSKDEVISFAKDEHFISDEEDNKRKDYAARFRHSRRSRRNRRPSCTVSFCEQYFADMVVEVENNVDVNVGKRVRSKTFTEGSDYLKDEQI